ncbi:hypothetical protein X975_11755, partial [Stegodyphus mimosarum]
SGNEFYNWIKSGDTHNHIVRVDLRPINLSGSCAEKFLDSCIFCNKKYYTRK